MKKLRLFVLFYILLLILISVDIFLELFFLYYIDRFKKYLLLVLNYRFGVIFINVFS